MKKNIIYLSAIIILVITSLLGIYFSLNHKSTTFNKDYTEQIYNNSHASLKTFKYDHNTIINNDILFNSSPFDLFNNTEYSVQNKVIFELGNRSLNNDIVSFKRLITLSEKSDGSYAENIYSYIFKVFHKNPSFFFDNMNTCNDSVILRVYITIFIHHQDLQINHYSKYGYKSKRFIDLYKEYKNKPDLMVQKAFNST